MGVVKNGLKRFIENRNLVLTRSYLIFVCFKYTQKSSEVYNI